MPPRSRASDPCRPSRAAWAFVAALTLLGPPACAGTEPSVFPTATELPKGPRRPDGVAIDLATLAPGATPRASTQLGLVTLGTPLGDGAVFEALDAFFRVAVTEDTEALGELLTRDAILVSPTPGPGTPRTPTAATHFAQRFRRLEYDKLAGETIFRRAEVSIVHAGDARDLGGGIPSLDELSAGEIAVRVPIVATRVGTERVFADEIVFFLRPEGARYRIRRIVEDFQMP